MEEQLKLDYKLIPELEETGSRRELEGVLPLGHFFKGYQLYKLKGGISYKIELSNTGEGVLLTGRAHGSGSTECARCLDDALFDVEGDVEGFFVLKPSNKDVVWSDDEFTAVPPDGIVDLKPPILAAIIYELPQVILCKEECAGMCQHCGINFNTDTCNCIEEPELENPFAILRGLMHQN